MVKKALGILMCCWSGMVALGEGAFQTIDFNRAYLWGKTPQYGLDDDGGIGSDQFSYWFYYGTNDNASVIREYTTAERAGVYDRFDSASNRQPEYMTEKAGNQGFLEVATGSTLVRALKPASTAGARSSVPIPEGDLFIDTLAQFVSCEEGATEIPTPAKDGANKLICWLSVPEGGATTNFIVTAGHFDADGGLTVANYVTTNAVEPGKWYRVTARAIANGATDSGDEVPCFVLYLDGQKVACAASSYAIGENASAMEARFRGNAHYADCALFPILQRIGGAYRAQALYGLAAQGAGALDEIGASETNPMVEEGSAVPVRLVYDSTAITQIVCTITAPYRDEPLVYTNKTEFTAELSDTLSIETFAKAQQMVAESPVLSGNKAVVASQSGYLISFADDSFADAEPLVVRIETTSGSFRVGSDYYDTFANALAAALEAGEPTISLASDVTLSADDEDGQAWIRAGEEIILDLAGKTIKGDHFAEEAAIYNQGLLTIIDTSGTGLGAIEAPGTVLATVRDNDALETRQVYAATTLGSESHPEWGDFTVRGRVVCSLGELTVYGGSYLAPSDTSATDFYLKEYLPDTRYTATPFNGLTDGLPYFRVRNVGNQHVVTFTTAYGTATPAQTNVTDGAVAEAATVEAVGRRLTGWLLEGAPYDFATPVTGDLELEANLEPIVYTVTNDWYLASEGFPTNYTVADATTVLARPTKKLFAFAGWVDRATGHRVSSIGHGATFDDAPETPVTGNLDLVATWTSNALGWENTAHDLVESNGTYSGRWPLVIPVQDGLARGAQVKITEIALGIVNPNLYPKTASRLSVTCADTSVATSRERTYETDGAGEYVNWEKLANGRPKVAYGFDDLVVEAGRTNWVSFAGSVPSGGVAVRLMKTTSEGYTTLGNCQTDGSPDARYLDYCPAYEIKGEAVFSK